MQNGLDIVFDALLKCMLFHAFTQIKMVVHRLQLDPFRPTFHYDNEYIVESREKDVHKLHTHVATFGKQFIVKSAIYQIVDDGF